MRRPSFLPAWILSLLIALPGAVESSEHAAAPEGYVGFAAKSQMGALDEAECRGYGGIPVRNAHADVVLKIGRRDAEHENVIFYGGDYYVPFRIRVSSLFGDEYHVRLCHFS